MIYAIIAGLLFGIGDVFLKISSVNLNSVKVLILNAISTLPIAILIFLLFNGSFPSLELCIKGILVQSLSAFALMFMFIALIKGPVSIVSSIISAYSMVAVIGSLIFLHEHLLLHQYILIFSIILGSILISYEKDNNSIKNKSWIIFSFLATLLWGIWAILAKPLLNTIEPWTMGVFFGIIAPFVWLPFILKYKSTQNYKWTYKGIFTGILSILITSIGAIFFYIALKKIPVSLATPITASHPFVTIVISHIFLKEKLRFLQYIGILLIILGVIFLQ